MLVKLICTASFIFSKACLYRYSFREGQFCTSNVVHLKFPREAFFLLRRVLFPCQSSCIFSLSLTYLFFNIKPIIRKNKPPSMMFRFLQCCVNHARRMEGRRFEPCWKHFPWTSHTLAQSFLLAAILCFSALLSPR